MRNKTLIKAMSGVLSAAVALPGMCVPVMAADEIPEVQANVVPLTAYYDEPADTSRNGWEQHASQLGNGFLGAMVHGGVGTNKIQINEHSIWSGGPGSSADYDGGAKGDAEEIRKELHEVQQDLQDVVNQFRDNYAAHDDGTGKIVTKNYTDVPDYKNKGIDSRVKDMFGEKDHFGSYQTLGDLYISNSDGNDTYTNYSRKLDLDNSILTIEYDQKGVHYTGEYFISNPYNVMAVHLTADKGGTLSKEIRIDSIQPNKSITGDAKNNVLTMQGRPSDHGENGEKFAQQVKVDAKGGSTLTMGGTIYVDDADEITIYMTAGTNYKLPSQDNEASYDTGAFFSDENPLDAVKERINYVSGKLGYEKLKSAHNADYKKLFDAEKVDFGAKAVPQKTTDELLAGYGSTNTADEDLYLETLYYQFGRYLLISSSRNGFLNIDGEISHQGELPANLQGIWADQLSNAWNADYHTNINVQMNYWLAQQTNLTECHMPMINYINSLVPYGEAMVNHYYVQPDGKSDVRGWTVGHECNIWGNAAPGESGASWFPTAAAWICQDIWEYYQFTKDEKFLEDNYDTLLKAAQFWVDFLWEDTRDGKLVANPSYSPEHGPFSLGTACEQGIIWEIFNEVLTASRILGKEDEAVAEVKRSFDNLSDNLQIGKNGQFMEWKDEVTIDVTGDNGHRHTNHLFVLHPGNQVVAGRSAEDDKYIDAMKNTLNTRGDSSTGWSMAWKLNFWTRLRDGNRAHTLVSTLLKEKTADNLFDLHPPFQIDGNFGATAGMTEMLLQSQGDSIDLLPALPDAWAKGSAEGIKARGNVEVDMSWSHGYLTAAVLRPANDGEYKITGKNIALGTVADSKGKTVQGKEYTGYVSEATGKTANDYLVLDLKGGETYTIYALDNQDDVSAAKAELNDLIKSAKTEMEKHPSNGEFYDADANAALVSEIGDAEKAINSSALFDLIDAQNALKAAIDTYKSSYDVQLAISLEDGIYSGIQKAEISCTSKIVEIKYTTDGTEPTAESAEYENGIYIPYGKTVLTAQPFYNGKAAGDAVAGTYFITADEDLAKGASAEEIIAEGDKAVTLNGYPVSRIVNGNADRWATTSNANKELIAEITLKNDTSFDCFLLDEFQEKSNESRIKTFELSYQDGSEWKMIELSDDKVYLVKGAGEGNQHFYRAAVLSETITAKKIRLTMKGGSISLWEFGLYNTAKTDKSNLNALIAECEALDTNEYNDSESFVAALASAKAIAADENASAVEILSAENNLKDAKAEMTGSGSAVDKSLVAVFSNAQNRVCKPEGNKLRSDWNTAEGTSDAVGIKAAGPDGKTSQNPYYYFDADIKIASDDASIDLDDMSNPIWKTVKLLMRSNITGAEYRSEAATINNLDSDYIEGTMSDFHVHIPLTAIPNRTGNNADVSIDWNSVKQMKFDVEVSDWAVQNGTYNKLNMTIENAKLMTTEPGKAWDYDDQGGEPEDQVNYTLAQLLDELAEEVDPDKYTSDSYDSYASTAENAWSIANDADASQKNINRAYLAVVSVRRALVENTQDNWAATFSNSNGTFSVLNAAGTQLYDDWKQLDQGVLDASVNRSDLRLQMTVVTQYKGNDVPAKDMLSRLIVKLRSADKANVDGDPETGNREHNYGWDIIGEQLGDSAVLKLSIPLDSACTNSKGVMDWSDIRKLIVVAPLKGDYAKDGTNCTMQISSARIIDMAPINENKEMLSALVSKDVNLENCNDEVIDAYNVAKENAIAVTESADETISLYDINKAYTALAEAIDALVPTVEENTVKVTADAAYADGNVSYTFRALSDKPIVGTMVIAVYDAEQRLVGLDIKDSVEADGTELSGSVAMTENPAKCRIFFWDSLLGIKSLAESTSISFE